MIWPFAQSHLKRVNTLTRCSQRQDVRSESRTGTIVSMLAGPGRVDQALTVPSPLPHSGSAKGIYNLREHGAAQSHRYFSDGNLRLRGACRASTGVISCGTSSHAPLPKPHQPLASSARTPVARKTAASSGSSYAPDRTRAPPPRCPRRPPARGISRAHTPALTESCLHLCPLCARLGPSSCAIKSLQA